MEPEQLTPAIDIFPTPINAIRALIQDLLAVTRPVTSTCGFDLTRLEDAVALQEAGPYCPPANVDVGIKNPSGCGGTLDD